MKNVPLVSFIFFSTALYIGECNAVDMSQEETSSNVETFHELPEYVSKADGSIDKAQIPMREAMWAFFNLIVVTEEKDPGFGKVVLEKAMGLTGAQSTILFNHIRSSTDDIQGYSNKLMIESCSNSEALNRDKGKLANALVAIDRKVDKRRQSHIDSLSVMLDSGAEYAVREWVENNIRPRTKAWNFDHRKFLDTTNVTVKSYLSKMCQDNRHVPS